MSKDIENNFENLNIDTDRLLIRHVQKNDSKDFFEMFSDEKTAVNDGCGSFTKMDEAYQKDFNYLVCDKMHFSIELKECHKMIGLLHLTKINTRAVKCYEIGYDIHYAYRRHGYAAEAIKALLNYCFNVLNIDMITASVYDWNKESVNLLNKLGFIQEGKIHNAEKHYKYGIIDILSFYIER